MVLQYLYTARRVKKPCPGLVRAVRASGPPAQKTPAGPSGPRLKFCIARRVFLAGFRAFAPGFLAGPRAGPLQAR